MLCSFYPQTTSNYKKGCFSFKELTETMKTQRERGVAGRTFFSRELLHSFRRLTCCTAELASWALICWFVPCENEGAECEASLGP